MVFVEQDVKRIFLLFSDNHAYWSLGGFNHSFGALNVRRMSNQQLEYASFHVPGETRNRSYPCSKCDKVFSNANSRWYHIKCVHEKVNLTCVCGKQYSYRPGLLRHQKNCSLFSLQENKSQTDAQPKWWSCELTLVRGFIQLLFASLRVEHYRDNVSESAVPYST